MRSGTRNQLRAGRLVGLAILLLGTGACSTTRPVDPLNVLALGKPPIRIGVTELELAPPLMLPKRTLFQENLEFHLNEPLSFELMTPRQIRVHLGTGRLKFAMVSAADYAEIAPARTSQILAVPTNERGATSRRGLIIVAAKSPITSIAQLKGRRFHYLPRADLLNEAARGVLLEAGIKQNEIDSGLLGLGLDTYHISSLEVAKSVVVEERVAGVIDEADFNSWKPTGGSVLLLTPSRDEVRIIGRTVSVPEGPVLVSSETPADLAHKVSDYLLKDLPKRKLILASLGCKGFGPPIETREYEPFFEVHRRLHPMPETPGTTTEPDQAELPPQ